MNIQRRSAEPKDGNIYAEGQQLPTILLHSLTNHPRSVSGSPLSSTNYKVDDAPPTAPRLVPTTRPSSEQPSFGLTFLSSSSNSESELTPTSEKPHARDSHGLSPSSHKPRRSGVSYTQAGTNTRYYTQALTSQDHSALTQGEQNHNLGAWSPKNVVAYHETRKELVPQSMNKVKKIETLANIEHEIQLSRNILKKKKQRRFTQQETPYITYNRSGSDPSLVAQQASQSMYEPIPAPQLSPMLLPPTPLPRFYTFHETGTSGHVRAATSSSSNPQAPSQPPQQQQQHPPNSIPYSPKTSPSTLHNPPNSQPYLHQHDSETTFDTFLVPHKSGKGEAYRGAENAKSDKPKVFKHKRFSTDEGSSPRENGVSQRVLRKGPFGMARWKTGGLRDDEPGPR